MTSQALILTANRNLRQAPTLAALRINRFHWSGDITFVSATVKRWTNASDAKELREVDEALQECASIPSTDGQLALNPSLTQCVGGGFPVKHGGVLEVRLKSGNSTHVFRARIPAMELVPATDLGLQLTLLDRWEDGVDANGTEIDEGFRVHEGITGYVAISRLKHRRPRLIASLTTLDDDPDVDFELGVGLGVLYRLGEDENGVGVAAGLGYNLMADQSADGWYTFLGFGYNFQLRTP